jgi:polyhydroxybutyrate depolymerase
MTLSKYCMIALIVITAMLLPLGGSVPVAAELASGSADTSPGLHTGWMTEVSSVNASWVFNRTFEYYIPSSYTGSEEVPLLFSFNGLGSNGDEQRDLTKFDVLAEEEGFIAVFPSSTNLDPDDPRWSALNLTLPDLTGSNIMWNCGAINGTPIAPLQYVAGIDDVAFVSDMVSWFETFYDINTSEIYSTGMSNGAMFSYYLTFNLPGMFAAIAPVCAPMPLNLGVNAGITPPPMTVVVMRGSSDPIIPEPGQPGLIEDNFSFNTSATIAYWCGIDGINMATQETITTWAATTSDPTSVTRYVYGPGTDGSKVILLWITGGGHQWPGATPYLPFILGPATTHVDGSAQIWKYVPPDKYCLTTHATRGGSVSTPGQEVFANDEFDGATAFFPANISPTQINLTARPDSKCRFVNWTGDVDAVANPDAATTTVTIQPNTDCEVTANFIAQYDLTISSTSGGKVTMPGEGTHTYDVDTVVNLVATPDSGYQFVRWTGSGIVAYSHAASTTITMSRDCTVTANFEETPAPSAGCFIATAAYGTSTAEQLDVLRAFRDDVLLKSTVGSRLVEFYYRTSPPIAEFMSRHEVLRTLVRELLIDPIVWVAQATENMWQT